MHQGVPITSGHVFASLVGPDLGVGATLGTLLACDQAPSGGAAGCWGAAGLPGGRHRAEGQNPTVMWSPFEGSAPQPTSDSGKSSHGPR